MIISIKRILLTLTLFISINSFAGGGWSEKKGAGFFKLGQYVIISDDFFNPMGEVITIPTVSYYATSIYTEYGLTDRLTGVAYIPFFVRTTLNEIEFRQSGNTIPGDEETNIGDPLIGVKYGFFQDGPFVVGVSLLLGLPLGEDQGGEGQILQTGDGEFNQLIKIDVSRSFYPKPIYATVTAGFNNRTNVFSEWGSGNGFSEEIHYGFEIGYTLREKTLIALKIYGVESLKNGDPGGSAGNGIFSNNTEYLSITPEISHNIGNNWGLTGAVGFAFSGERILASPAYQAGVYFNLRK